MSSVARFSLLPHDQTFFDLFVEAGKNSVHSAQLLDKLMREWPDAGTLHQDIVEAEHRGDKVTHDIIKRLNTTFVTPIDREDILRLSAALDDIVDLIEEVADYLTLYGIEAPMVQAQALARVLLDAIRQIDSAIPLMREFKSISKHTIEVHRLENEGDRIVRGAIACLFEGGIDPMVVIRWKDIFELLEDAIDATERAAFVLDGIVIKNA